MVGFPKGGLPFWRVPIKRTIVFWGFHIRVPVFRETTICLHTLTQTNAVYQSLRYIELKVRQVFPIIPIRPLFVGFRV